jgi:AcrR family transcriptional regulator
MSTHLIPQSGHESRSEKTRTQLIEAAIEVIGAVGYEGASTRILAKTANTALSAIPYHFGGKRELYLAAAQVIADYADNRFAEAVSVLEVGGSAEASLRFEEALVKLLHIMLEDAEPASWTPFVARCCYDNDEAFALIYDQAIAPLIEALVCAAGGFSSPSLDDEAVRLRISSIVTAIISFRFLRGITLRSMDWEQFQTGCIGQIEAMVRELCRGDFVTVRLSQ